MGIIWDCWTSRHGHYAAEVNGVPTMLSITFHYELFRQAIRSAASIAGDPLPDGQLEPNIWYPKADGREVIMYDFFDYTTFLGRLNRGEIMMVDGRVVFSLLGWARSPDASDREDEDLQIRYTQGSKLAQNKTDDRLKITHRQYRCAA